MPDESESRSPVPSANQNPAQPTEHQPSDEDKPKPIIGAVLAPERSPRHESAPAKKYSELSAWEKFERWAKGIECTAFVGGVASALIIGYQYSEMVKAGKIAEKQLDIMRGQLDEMKQERLLDQRAWINPLQTVIFPGKDGNSWSLGLNFKNVGKTIGIVTNIDLCLSTNAGGKAFSGFMDAKATQILFPDVGSTTIVGPIDIHFLNDTLAGKISIYFYGRVDYSDIFKRQHFVRFQFLFDPKNNTIYPTQDGNEFDTND